MNDAEVSILVRAKDEATKTLQGISGAAKGLSGALATAAGTAAGFVIGSGITQLPGFLFDAAQAAADDAASMAKLQQAVTNTGASWGQYKDQLGGVVENAQRLGFTDDQARDALSLLVAQTDDAGEAQRRFALAMNLSRGANIDVVTASKLLGKVTDENVNVLNRYGISVKKGASEAELFGAVQAKFGGQAETFAKSTAGQMARAKIQMQELQESLGYALLPVLTFLVGILADHVAPALSTVIGWVQTFISLISAMVSGDLAKAGDLFNQLPGPLQAVALWLAANKEAIEGFLGAVRDLALSVVDLVQSFAQWLVDSGTLETMLTGLRTIGEALLAIWQAELPILQKIVGFFQDHREAAIALGIALGVVLVALFPIPAAILAVIYAVGLLSEHWDDIKAKTLDVWNAIGSFIDDHLSLIRTLLEDEFKAYVVIATFAFDTIRNVVETAINQVRDIIRIVMALIHGDWDEAWGGIKDLAADTWQGIYDQIDASLTALRGLLDIGWSLIRLAAASAWGGVRDVIAGIWIAIKSAAVDALNFLIGKINDVISGINTVGGLLNDILPGNPVGELGAVPYVGQGGAGIGGGSRGTRGLAEPGDVAASAQVNNTYHIYVDQWNNQGDAAAGLAALSQQVAT